MWNQGTDSIHDMHVMNTDVILYQSKTLEECLEYDEREMKKNHLNNFLSKRQHFTPFFALVCGLFGADAKENA